MKPGIDEPTVVSSAGKVLVESASKAAVKLRKALVFIARDALNVTRTAVGARSNTIWTV